MFSKWKLFKIPTNWERENNDLHTFNNYNGLRFLFDVHHRRGEGLFRCARVQGCGIHSHVVKYKASGVGIGIDIVIHCAPEVYWVNHVWDVQILNGGNINLVLMQHKLHLHCCKIGTGHRNIAVDCNVLDFWNTVWKKKKSWCASLTPNSWCAVGLSYWFVEQRDCPNSIFLL